tara:strand:- start:248 stop:436 length:189 start_codon:yes stop_codon:yes gene_type:complete
MLETLLLNTIKSLILDKAQSLAGDHVEAMIDANFDKDQKEALDKVVDAMPDNSFKSVRELFG